MKFQNPSFKIFLNGQMHARTDKPKPICSPLFQSWGHKKRICVYHNLPDPVQVADQTAQLICAFAYEIRHIFSCIFVLLQLG